MTKLDKNIEAISDINLLRDIWDELVNQCDSDNVFLSFDWISCWLHIYKGSDEPYILVVKEDNVIIAIAPFIIVKYKEIGIKCNRLQFIGSRSCDYMDFIIIKEHDECVRLILEYILKNNFKWDYCELHHISDTFLNFSILSKYVKENQSFAKIYKESVCPFLKLDFKIEEFYKTRTSGLRYDLKKGENELMKIGSLVYLKITDQLQALNELSQFFSLLYEREQFKGRHRSKIFIEKQKKIFNYYVQNNDFWNKVNFCKLSIDGKAFAYHFGFEYKKKIYWYKPTFDIAYIKFSPGKLMIKKTIEYALENNYVELDFLLGNEPYKYQWAKDEKGSYSFFLTNKKLKSKFLNIWFSKIKPIMKENKVLSNIKRNIFK